MRDLAGRYRRQYRWLRQLGNENYKGGAIVLNDAKAGVDHVCDLLRLGCTVILLCGCKDPATCHRTHAAGLIRERMGGELEIEHLVKADANEAKKADPQGRLFGE